MIIINISTDNDAFSDGNYDAEVARILRELADRAEYGIKNEYVPLRDINGNKVGEFTDAS